MVSCELKILSVASISGMAIYRFARAVKFNFATVKEHILHFFPSPLNPGF